MPLLRKLYLKFLLGACLLISGLFYFSYGVEGYNFYGDALGYYMYLPNAFIYGNHKSVETLPKDRGIRPFIHGYAAQMGSGQRGPKGYVVNQYTYGTALMEAPFFLAAHSFEKARGTKANGFTESYRNAIDISSFVYGMLGLWFCYRFLRRCFSQNIAATAIALLLVGTNLFWFIFRQQGMAHVPIFFLFALLTELTIRVHERSHWRDFFAIGLVAGLITVIRPVDGVCVLIPILYSKGPRYFPTLLSFTRRHWWKIGIAGVSFAIPIIPQLMYWKWLTGYWVYDSYGPGQGFDFRHPAIWTGVFSASNGWLFYTPLMLLALIGLLMPRRLMGFSVAIPVVLIVYIWAIYAWFLPNYINGFGSRPMVDVYALLTIPLAAFLEKCYRQKVYIRTLATVCIVCFAAWNLSASVQQATGLLLSQDSKYRYNFQTVFRLRLRYNDLVLWDTGVPQPDLKKLVQGGRIQGINLRDTNFRDHVRDSAGTLRYVVQDGEEYPPLRPVLKGSDLGKGATWIKCYAKLKVHEPGDDLYSQQMLVLQIRRGDSTRHWYGMRINKKIGWFEGNVPPEGLSLGRWRENTEGALLFYAPVPNDLRPDDKLQLDIWNISRKPMEILDLSLRSMRAMPAPAR